MNQRAMYHRRARTITWVTVVPSVAALSLTIAHRSSGTRTLRMGVCVSRISGPHCIEREGVRVRFTLLSERGHQFEDLSHTVRGRGAVVVALHRGTNAGKVGAPSAASADALSLGGGEEVGPADLSVHDDALPWSVCKYTVTRRVCTRKGVSA